jgi:REP element-mobilizing transposase RayT
MQIRPYEIAELRFAWCNRVYLRSRTHLRKPSSHLGKLQTNILADRMQPYGIQVLELATNAIAFRVLLSLLPTESVSAAASKTKGRISKWLSEQEPLQSNAKPLARGYFAVTTGQSTTDAVDAYLDKQSEHHGYANRARPPIFVRQISHSDQARQALQTDHAATLLRYHAVLATWFRKGVFNEMAAAKVTDDWLTLQGEYRFLLDKVSFVPDHVQLALSLHPTRSPAEVVLALMNATQRTMWDRYETVVIQSGVERLWQASGYIGSFGELTSNAVSASIERWAGLRD